MPIFEWEFTSAEDPSPSPFVVLRIAGIPINALFDTGASVTSLAPVWMGDLGIRGRNCLPKAVAAAHGGLAPALLTFVDGMLNGDEHSIRIPVVFVMGISHDVIGVAGLIEHYAIVLDPTEQRTSFDWVPNEVSARMNELETAWMNGIGSEEIRGDVELVMVHMRANHPGVSIEY